MMTTKKLAYLTTQLVLICIISFMVLPSGIVHASGQTNDNTLLQFTSAGHVLGFSQQAVYLAGLDHALRVEFAGGFPAQPVAEGAGMAQNGAAPLGKVTYSGVWKNIDVIYSTVAGGIIESAYIIRPGGDPADISLRYNVPVEITPQGGLCFNFENGCVTESTPVAWQEIDGERLPVAVRFQGRDENQIGFALAGYDTRHALYIDPTFQWHTFYGSTSPDSAALKVALDSNANIYVTGTSNATWDGPGGVAPLNPYAASTDIVIVKLNSAGTYQWHTFYGSSVVNQQDYGNDITVDSSANVYVAGRSERPWNGPGGVAPKNAHTTYMDMFIIKLNSAGTYQWHTFHGGTNFDSAEGIALGSGGNIYVAGSSYDTWDGPGAVAPKHGFTGIAGNADFTIIKLNNAGIYQWHTFYGSTSHEISGKMAVDSVPNIYMTGYSNATWNGPTGELPKNHHAGDWDITILKLNGAGTYQWHTFYGSSGNDRGYGIVLGPLNSVYIAGSSGAPWNGPGDVAPLNAYTEDFDIAIIKLNSAGIYQWHTFYGSTADDYGYSISLDPATNIHVVGSSYATWNGPGEVAPLNPYTGGVDIAILKLNSAGTYQWHTFYGSSGEDQGRGIALDPAANIYAAGYSAATWNGPGGVIPLNPYTGSYDIVVIRMIEPPAPPPSSPPPPPPPRSGVSPQLPPADIQLHNFSVNPGQVQAGQSVTVTANVVNNGASSGSYNVALRINGKVEQQRTIEVSPGTAYPVKFTVAKSQPGTYDVAIEGQKTSFTVLGADTSRAPASSGLIALVVMAVLLLATVVVLVMTFRRPV